MQQTVKKFSKIMLAAGLVLMLLLEMPGASEKKSSSDSTECVLSVAEAESVLAALDTYETRLRLSRLSLAESRELSRIDSLSFAIYKEETRRTWLDKILQQPVLWLVLGTYLGMQACRL